MVTHRTQFGFDAEQAAAQWLQERGYRILDQNWRRPWGELDIVAEHNDIVVFIEVKAASRYQEGFDPFLRANSTKMHKVRRTAQTWLLQHHYGLDTEWQIDVISVVQGQNGQEFEHFESI